MKLKATTVIAFLFAIAAFCTLEMYAQTVVTLNPAKDNTLYENPEGSLSNGAGDHFFAGKTNGGFIRRGLLAFDIAGNIPQGATITQVSLSLSMSRTVAGNNTVSLHAVSSDWGEGASDAAGNEGGGAGSQSGDATWLHTFFNTNLWTAQGGDFASTASASTVVGNVGSYIWSSPEMVTDVQSWLDNASTNFGGRKPIKNCKTI
jgi:hypothetical protein